MRNKEEKKEELYPFRFNLQFQSLFIDYMVLRRRIPAMSLSVRGNLSNLVGFLGFLLGKVIRK